MAEIDEAELARVQALSDQMHGRIHVQPKSRVPYLAHPPAPPAHLPGAPRFVEAEVGRLDVLVSLAAAEVIVGTSSEGRAFPQALAEAFATIGEVKEVRIETIKKRERFRLRPDEQATDPDMLVITAIGQHPQWSHTWHIHVADFCTLREDMTPRLCAAELAEKMLSEYPHSGKGA